MNLDRLERIKKLVIIALFSDDDFMEILVFKGGNAIDLIHGVAMRGSIDLDFSLESDFVGKDERALQKHFENLLNRTFHPEGLRAFDVAFESRPQIVSPDLQSFWGGYNLEFKVIEIEDFETHKAHSRRLRMAAEYAGPRQIRKFRVDFSRHEYCASKEEHELDGYTIYVYTPVMIVCEKIRAICQQMPEYLQLVRSQRGTARARDFFDICTLVKHFHVDMTTNANRELLKRIFAAKRVPLHLMNAIREQREFHRSDFAAVKDTVKPNVDLHEFDFYFDYVVTLVESLQPFGVE